MIKIRRALISVSDKTGLILFVKGLHALGIELLSTGGTAKAIKEAGIPVKEVSDYTGFPEILDGRVKTLHPKIHAGILAVRDNPEHLEQLTKHKADLIDMVVNNLYPFAKTIQKKRVSLEEALENIDIGGPTMIRAAAKNYKNVAVVIDPTRYPEVLKELDTNSGILSDSVLFRLAVNAFRYTAEYENIISGFFNMRLRGQEEFEEMPRELMLRFSKLQDLRYGENPHQKAAFYNEVDGLHGLARLKQLHGKELSFNNILDLNAAVDFVKDLNLPAAAIVKHGNPTGVAQDKTLIKAYKAAWDCDPTSAFGGIVGLNHKVDLRTATAIIKSGFLECVIAPAFEPEALGILKQKKNLRVVELNLKNIKNDSFDFKKVHGGLLLQETDHKELSPSEIKVVTKKKPTAEDIEAFQFGWKIVKNVRSNAILLVKGQKTVGIGCGQTSRVESVRVAIQKAQKNAKGAVMISDAFLPKTDNVQLAAKAGVKAIIQTGGSIADGDVIKQADKSKIVMVMTGLRHFKH